MWLLYGMPDMVNMLNQFINQGRYSYGRNTQGMVNEVDMDHVVSMVRDCGCKWDYIRESRR